VGFLQVSHENVVEATFRYLLSLIVTLAQAFEGLTRNLTAEESQQFTKKLEELTKQSEDRIDKHLAQRLSELLDIKGHEGMYDTGTKPSGTN
jgi:hypothetical protein